MQKDPENFKAPKRVRYHWGGSWEALEPNNFLKSIFYFRYVGGKHVDKTTSPTVKILDITNMLKEVACVDPHCHWDMWSLQGNIRSSIGNDVQLSMWWSTIDNDEEGLVHLYIDWIKDFQGVYHPNGSPCRVMNCPCWVLPFSQEASSPSNLEGNY